MISVKLLADAVATPCGPWFLSIALLTLRAQLGEELAKSDLLGELRTSLYVNELFAWLNPRWKSPSIT